MKKIIELYEYLERPARDKPCGNYALIWGFLSYIVPLFTIAGCFAIMREYNIMFFGFIIIGWVIAVMIKNVSDEREIERAAKK